MDDRWRLVTCPDGTEEVFSDNSQAVLHIIHCPWDRIMKEPHQNEPATIEDVRRLWEKAQ